MVQYLGLNQNSTLAKGLPLFSTIRGGVVSMMRDPKKAGGRAFLVLRASEHTVRGKRIPTRFQCYIPLEEEEDFISKFSSEGSAFSIEVKGYPKLENDGTYYRSPHEGNMAFVLVAFANLLISPAQVKEISTRMTNKKRMNFASEQEMAPVVRSAIQSSRD
jgi:hypothetical protein